MKALTIFMTLIAAAVQAQPQRNVAEYNLNSAGEGVTHIGTSQAYDPVGYFPEGGGRAQIGLAEFALDYQGVRYLFASAENMEQFLTDPSKYEPTYGGWCARAMVAGSKVEINTNYFTISGNRLHFFVNRRAKRFFDRDIARYETLADENWRDLSGEGPRK